MSNRIGFSLQNAMAYLQMMLDLKLIFFIVHLSTFYNGLVKGRSEDIICNKY